MIWDDIQYDLNDKIYNMICNICNIIYIYNKIYIIIHNNIYNIMLKNIA